MDLVCGRKYRVGVILTRATCGRRSADGWGWVKPRERRILEVELEYCGGSVVDEQGHYLGCSVWSHEKLPYQICDLNIAYMYDARHKPKSYQRWTPEEVRRAAAVVGRHWRRHLLAEEEAAADGPYGRIV